MNILVLGSFEFIGAPTLSWPQHSTLGFQAASACRHPPASVSAAVRRHPPGVVEGEGEGEGRATAARARRSLPHQSPANGGTA
jgi:hypothetical protein